MYHETCQAGARRESNSGGTARPAPAPIRDKHILVKGAWRSMVKIALPILAAALAAIASAARAEPPDCNGFADFRARMTCYELVSRAPPARAEPAQKAKPQPVRRRPRNPD
jgi:hypothetical protein